MSGIFDFLRGCGRQVFSGGRAYKAWVAFLLATIVVGGLSYAQQARGGLIVTNMRDEVSWAFYIGNFTFLVGVAAAAVLLVIPAYVYHWKPIKEVVVLGELLAISALVMCLLFILVDMGRPDRFLHIMPFLGTPNFPRSLLAWDALVLNSYLLVNVVLVSYLLVKTYRGESYDKRIFIPLVLLSIPVSLSTHTVTAFLYNGMAARPYWNASILAPRFIASAFCSGPAVMIILFQVLRRTAKFPIQDEAIWKIAELMAYAMFVNLFLLGAELFKEFYSATEHLLYTQYLWIGIGEHRTLVPYAWFALFCSVAAFVLFLIPTDAQELRDAEPRMPAHLGGRLHREGHGAHHPRHDARHARPDLRVPAERGGVGRRGGRLRDRVPRVHGAREDRRADPARDVPRGGSPRELQHSRAGGTGRGALGTPLP